LYVCDASTFPEALDRPTVLTILGLGKRLAAHLASETRAAHAPATRNVKVA
jgi:choline dehydrogenase-like flavoprotein